MSLWKFRGLDTSRARPPQDKGQLFSLELILVLIFSSFVQSPKKLCENTLSPLLTPSSNARPFRALTRCCHAPFAAPCPPSSLPLARVCIPASLSCPTTPLVYLQVSHVLCHDGSGHLVVVVSNAPKRSVLSRTKIPLLSNPWSRNSYTSDVPTGGNRAFAH